MNEEVVLLDEEGNPTGTAAKAAVHTDRTPLHLAFSCHVTDAQGSLLVTRRALQKRTWPGVWTNAFCGHPQPGEAFKDAIGRHGEHELGLQVTAVTLAVSDFRYRAVDASGIVENEICPVYTAEAAGPLQPNPAEVMDLAWVRPQDLAAAITHAPWAFSPWLVLQAERLPLFQTDQRPD